MVVYTVHTETVVPSRDSFPWHSSLPQINQEVYCSIKITQYFGRHLLHVQILHLAIIMYVTLPGYCRGKMKSRLHACLEPSSWGHGV